MAKHSTRRSSAAVGIIAFIGAMSAIAVPAQPPDQQLMNKTFSRSAASVVASAIAKAKERGRSEVGTELLLWALINDSTRTTTRILSKMNVPIQAMRLQTEAELAWTTDTGEEAQAGEPRLSEGFRHVLELAAEEAGHAPGEETGIGNEHLLLGLLRYKQDLPFSYTIFRKAGVTLEAVRQQIKMLRQG